MPAWAITALWQYGAPLLIMVLRKLGAISWAQALEARMLARLKTLKTYPEYPHDEPFTAPPGGTNTNATAGNPPPDDGFPKEKNSG